MSPTFPVTGDAAVLIDTVGSFAWRLRASLLGVVFAFPPSTLLLSSVTLTSPPATAWPPMTVGTSVRLSARPARASSLSRGRQKVPTSTSLPPLALPLNTWQNDPGSHTKEVETSSQAVPMSSAPARRQSCTSVRPWWDREGRVGRAGRGGASGTPPAPA